MDDQSRIVDAQPRLDCEGLTALLDKWKPAVVAIDSPPGPARRPGSSSRACERELRALGVNVFLTPSDAEQFSTSFYEWVRVGAQAFKACAKLDYPRQTDAAVVRGCAIEVFPHASDVFLRGCLPAPGTTRRVRTKRSWRLATLNAARVTGALCVNRLGRPTLDSIDAALAALTGLSALAGKFAVLGDPGEWIVVPGEPRRFERCT